MRNAKAVMLAGVIFVSGIVVGVAGTRFYVQRAVLRAVAGDMTRVEEVIMTRLDDRLGLSAAQRQAVRPILERALGELAAVRREARPRVDAILDRAVADMRPGLTPEQGQALTAMAARFRAARDAAAPADGPSRE